MEKVTKVKDFVLRNREAIIISITSLSCVLFGFSAIDKVLNHDSFRAQMGKSPLLTGYEDLLIWAVPAAEIAIAGLLPHPKTRLAGLYAFYTLMALFTFYIVALLRIDDSIPCGCNALTEKMSLEWHVAFNTVFAALSVLALVLHQTAEGIRRMGSLYRSWFHSIKKGGKRH